MSNKTFKDFNTKTPLADTDYIVGYKADGTEEFRTTLGNLIDYLRAYFVPRTMLEGLRINWDNTFTTVNSLSSNWSNAFNVANSSQNNWNSAYNTTRALSGNWNNTHNTTRTLSGNWNNAYGAITASSDNWNNTYNTTRTLSGNWNNTYNTTRALSGNWNNTHNTTRTLSGNWNNAYSTTNTFSADWQAVANLPPAQTSYTCAPCNTITNNVDRFWVNVAVRGDNESLVGCTSDGEILVNNLGGGGSNWISSFNNPNSQFSSQWAGVKIAENAIGGTNIGLPNNNNGGLIIALSEFNKDGVVYITNNAGQNWYASGPSKNRNWMRGGLLVSSSGDKIIALEGNGTLHRLNAGTEIVPWVNDSNWQIISNTPFNNNVGFLPTSIASTPDLNTIYVTAETSLSAAIFKSTDFGSTWTKTNTPSNFIRSIGVGNQSGTTTLWVVPHSSSLRQLYYSMNGGNTWTANGPSQLWHSVFVKESTIVGLSRFNNKIHISHNNGNSWSSPSTSTSKQWHSVAMPSINYPNVIYATQETGRLHQSLDAGIIWNELV
jgi:hypothetical protein